eukprot:tig00021612_g22887.t1
MKILTHNMLMCNVKGCDKGNFPLRIELSEPVSIQETEFNEDFARRLIGKVDWPALAETAAALGLYDKLGIPELPSTPPEAATADDALLKAMHRVLLEVQVIEGKLVCNNCGKAYSVSKGIPNMLLTQDEL